ncbi:MAG: hypothetical protein GC201_13285 [Alphaproteobacteria bacterium]|nr:hypothetical protein [Alphaproteobacteria bacterium]
MAYSDWQLNRLRDALRAYHDHGGRSLKEDFNWNSVAEAIAIELDRDDLPVSAERLRQFVEGNRGKDGAMRKFGTLKPESLEHVVAFAMKLRLLVPEELEEPAPSFHAPQRLLEYLDTRNDRVRVITPVMFDGRYKARVVEQRVVREFDLTLHRSREPGMMPVTHTEEAFDRNLLDKIDGWDPEERRRHCRKRTVYAGWAIFTPEDNVMVFLKEAGNGKNLYQFTLAADWYAPQTHAGRLFLLRHDYPIQTEAANRIEDDVRGAILEQTGENIVVFRRVA